MDVIPRSREYPPSKYGWYVISILMGANLCCYIVRMVLLVLVQPIIHDFKVSDTQIGLLQGAAFSVFFVVAGLPIGWLTDRRSRRNIVIASVVSWSVMTIFCGLAASFTQLFVARMGVGVGEAALTPAAVSLIADYFPPERRGRAMAVYYLGTPFGTGLATMVGGFLLRFLSSGAHLPLLQNLAPWKVIFVLAGAPGFIVALFLLTVREPLRHEVEPFSHRGANPSQFGVARFITNEWRALVSVCASVTLLQGCAYAVAAWSIPLLLRRDHMTAASAGMTFGLSIIATGLLGAGFGGIVGDKLSSQKKPGGRFRIVIYAALTFVPGVLLLTLATSPFLAAVGLIIEFFSVCVSSSVMYTILQDIVPNNFRGQAAAVLSLLLALGSATLGPIAVAVCTDQVFHNPDKVGFAILLATLPSAALCLAITGAGLRTYDASRERLRAG